MSARQRRQDSGRQGGPDKGRDSENAPQQSQSGSDNRSGVGMTAEAPRDVGSGQHEQQHDQQVDRRQQHAQNVHGEGNYAASRQYNDATKDFVQSGRVESAARAAAPRNAADARQMADAEAECKCHSKGEDPALDRKSGIAPDAPRAPRPGKGEE